MSPGVDWLLGELLASFIKDRSQHLAHLLMPSIKNTLWSSLSCHQLIQTLFYTVIALLKQTTTQ